MGDVRYKKMFGEYMVYINNKPILLVCNSIVYVKELDEIKELMANADKGFPYKGAKEQYVLDIDDLDLVKDVVKTLESIIPVPKPRRK